MIESPQPCAHEQRCDCGCLLARLVEGGVELKCRRCRRLVVVPLIEPQRPAASAGSEGPDEQSAGDWSLGSPT